MSTSKLLFSEMTTSSGSHGFWGILADTEFPTPSALDESILKAAIVAQKMGVSRLGVYDGNGVLRRLMETSVAEAA